MNGGVAKRSLNKIIPYISIFVLVFGFYLMFDLLKELNLILIPHKTDKFLGILFPTVLVILELSKTRDSLWRVWKQMSFEVHLVVTLFFSAIILRLFPIAWQSVWNNKNEE